MIISDFRKNSIFKEINNEVEGNQLNCPKGDKTKTQIDGPVNTDLEKNILIEEKEEVVVL